MSLNMMFSNNYMIIKQTRKLRQYRYYNTPTSLPNYSRLYLTIYYKCINKQCYVHTVWTNT